MHIAVPDFVSSTHIALLAAKELGIFRDEGQEVDIVHIPDQDWQNAAKLLD